jgi:hypothetical protein
MKKGAVSALLGMAALSATARAVDVAGPAQSAHDEFHHPRVRMTAGWKHRARLKEKRRTRNAMARASRRQNRSR